MILYLDYQNGEWISWYHSEGGNHHFMSHRDKLTIIRAAKRQGFNKFVTAIP